MHSNRAHQGPYKTAVQYVTWTPRALNGLTIIMGLQLTLEALQQLCELTQQCDNLNVCCTG